MRRISSSVFASSVRARLAGENVMMLLPGCRVVSLPRTRLAWFSTMLNDRFGVAMPYAASHGWGVDSSVRNAALT